MHFTLGLTLAVSAALSGSSSEARAIVDSMPQAQTVEEYVRSYFADTPVLAEIAQCESRFRQFNKDGSVLKNPTSSAIGVFQIMSSIHTPQAQKLGIDIKTIQGNMAYAKYLYDKEGTRPWNASKGCWGKTEIAKAHAELAINK